MIKDFYSAWKYLNGHPIFSCFKKNGDLEIIIPNTFKECLCVNVEKVNPNTGEVDNDPKLNTKTKIYLESGAFDGENYYNDIELDCKGDTFEEAIIKMANSVKQKYSDDPRCIWKSK